MRYTSEPPAMDGPGPPVTGVIRDVADGRCARNALTKERARVEGRGLRYSGFVAHARGVDGAVLE